MPKSIMDFVAEAKAVVPSITPHELMGIHGQTLLGIGPGAAGRRRHGAGAADPAGAGSQPRGGALTICGIGTKARVPLIGRESNGFRNPRSPTPSRAGRFYLSTTLGDFHQLAQQPLAHLPIGGNTRTSLERLDSCLGVRAINSIGGPRIVP